MVIYLDNSAATRMDVRVKKIMDPYFSKKYGNPGSFHNLGLEAKNAVENARAKVAKILGTVPESIIFTGSGTESINTAIQGVAKALRTKGRHIITSNIEHHAVLDTCKALEGEGYEVTYLDVDKDGLIDLEDLKRAIRKDTILITIMYANNEIGTIQPVSEIAKIARKNRIYFHTDACQVGGYLGVDVNNLGVDLMSLNGSKIYGPKGIGILYIKEGIKIEPIIFGGGQEFGLRSGTENVAGIVGFAKALEISQKMKKKESERLIKLRDYFTKELVKKIPRVLVNGHPTKRLPNNVNVSILDIEGESLVLRLNEVGVCAATGSACTSKRLEPSHVLLAIGRPAEVAHGSLRFSMGRETRKKDIDYVLKVLPKIVEDLRRISPVRIKI